MKQKNCAEREFRTLLEVIYHTYTYPFSCTLQYLYSPRLNAKFRNKSKSVEIFLFFLSSFTEKIINFAPAIG